MEVFSIKKLIQEVNFITPQNIAEIVLHLGKKNGIQKIQLIPYLFSLNNAKY